MQEHATVLLKAGSASIKLYNSARERLWNIIVRFNVVVMSRRAVLMRRLHRMAIELHMAMMSSGGRFDGPFGHYEFSCSSTPANRISDPYNIYSRRRRRRSSWDRRSLFGALPCVQTHYARDQFEEYSLPDHQKFENDIQGFPGMESVDEDEDDECRSYDNSNNNDCSPRSSSSSDEYSQVDRQAEEFIATFYKEMRLQRQDSYVRCQEMLARGST